MSNLLTFKQWMAEVDDELESICGLGHLDLPDANYRDEYDAGTTPAEMAEMVLEQEGFYDFA